MKTKNIELKIFKLNNELEKLYSEYIKAIFKDNDKLKSFYLESYEDYNDSNHFSAICIKEVNGVELPIQIRSEYDIGDFEENTGYKSFLLENNLNIKILYNIYKIIERVPVSFLSERYCFKEIKR